jgi:hypothetical protein
MHKRRGCDAKTIRQHIRQFSSATIKHVFGSIIIADKHIYTLKSDLTTETRKKGERKKETTNGTYICNRKRQHKALNGQMKVHALMNDVQLYLYVCVCVCVHVLSNCWTIIINVVFVQKIRCIR